MIKNLRWLRIDKYRNLKEKPFRYNHSFLKMALDYAITVPGLIFLLPFLLIVAILIKFDSPGPVIFTQKRVGLDKKIFNMYKFRSMYQNVDDALHISHTRAYIEGKLDLENGVKLKNDPRITRIGRIIRATSIDELPQLLNVLKREMSLVGPRPVLPYEVDKYKLWHSERLRVLPGITGLWQVSGRSYVSFDEQLRMDIRYIRNQSFWLDINIIFQTLPAVISKRGAG